VVDDGQEDLFRVDSARVSPLELVSHVNTAGDGTMSVDLSLHLISSLNVIVVSDVVSDVGGDSGAARKTVVAFSGWWPDAVTADVDWLASVLQVVSSVLLAGRVHKTVVVSPLVDLSGVSTIAGATSLAVNDYLSTKSNWSVSLQIGQDVESVCNR